MEGQTPIIEPAANTSEVIIPTNSPKLDSRAKLILAITSGILVAVILGFVYVLTSKTQPQKPKVAIIPPTATPITQVHIKVVYISGSAWKIVNGRKVEIKENDVLSETDEVMTDNDSRAVLSFEDGSIVRLSDDTDMVLTELKPSSLIINNKQGTIFARIHKDASHHFIVTAGAIKVTSMGTQFAVVHNDKVKVQVFESKVQIEQDNTDKGQLSDHQQWNDSTGKIEQITETTIKQDRFISWSLSQENLAIPTITPDLPKVTPTPVPTKSSSFITLSGTPTDDGISFRWQTEGLDLSKGFKLVKSINPNPVYPGDDNEYIDDEKARSYTLNINDGKSYHFRLCQYDGEKCGLYSNDITVQAPDSGAVSKVTALSVSVEKIADGKASVKWNVTGPAEKGFKVIWSDRSGPSYPTRDGDSSHYIENANTREDTVQVTSGKTYYFRVCEYLGESCGMYSNEFSLSL